MPVLTQDYLRSILDYDPEAGVFTWKSRHNPSKGWNKRRAGKPAGTKQVSGYIAINLFGVPKFAHRLAFLWMTGEMPKIVDHRDGDRANNAWANLRPANNSLNLANAKRRLNNKSGHKGVCWYRPLSKWHAQIHKDGKRIHLGYFETKKAAAEAYAKAATDKFGDYARVV